MISGGCGDDLMLRSIMTWKLVWPSLSLGSRNSTVETRRNCDVDVEESSMIVKSADGTCRRLFSQSAGFISHFGKVRLLP